MKRQTTKTSAASRPTISTQVAAQLLKSQSEKGRALLDARPIPSAATQAWEAVTQTVLIDAFGSDSPNITRVMDVGRWSGGNNETEWEELRATTLSTQLTILNGLTELLESTAHLTARHPSAESNATPAIGNRVFLVHGHNEHRIHETARWMEKFGLSVIILREQPNTGRTIIEKFVDFSDVGFAVVLITADDHGAPIMDPPAPPKPRARQNVVLELGFFLGKLGPKRVCTLYEPGVEMPSDYSGVLYVELDSQGLWRFMLARELKAAGFNIDLNLAG